MPIKKGDLVTRERGFSSSTQPWFLKPGLVISKPYEDKIHLTDVPLRVVDICIVVDIIIDNQIYRAVPVADLVRITGNPHV